MPKPTKSSTLVSEVWRTIKATENLPCELANEQLLEKGTRQSELVDEIAKLETAKKSQASHYKGEIETRQSSVAQLSRQIREKREYKDVLCEWRYGWHDPDSKSLIRLDTAEVVRTVPIQDHERQEMLKLELEKEQVRREQEDEAAAAPSA